MGSDPTCQNLPEHWALFCHLEDGPSSGHGSDLPSEGAGTRSSAPRPPTLSLLSPVACRGSEHRGRCLAQSSRNRCPQALSPSGTRRASCDPARQSVGPLCAPSLSPRSGERRWLGNARTACSRDGGAAGVSTTPRPLGTAGWGQPVDLPPGRREQKAHSPACSGARRRPGVAGAQTWGAGCSPGGTPGPPEARDRSGRTFVASGPSGLGRQLACQDVPG